MCRGMKMYEIKGYALLSICMHVFKPKLSDSKYLPDGNLSYTVRHAVK